MADTISWTEPLDSTRELWCLGIEYDQGGGGVRVVACMNAAACVSIGEWW
jgi:hypothetical protein